VAQFRRDIQRFQNNGNTIFEVVMLASNTGVPISTTNRLPVTLGTGTITITGNVNVGTVVSVNSTPGNPVHTHITEVGTSGLLAVPYLPVSGTVVVDEAAGSLFSFNNHATNTNRGWTMDETMRPVVSVRVNSSGTTITNLAEIIEYELGNNNANQSTIIYEWYEGNISISGAAIPSWTSLGTRCQYRVYQDKYSSNQGNTFTANGAIMRHSGIVIGKNSEGDEGPSTMNGGATPNMLTLCMRRVDSATKLDVWFAFTIKELA